MIPVEIDSGIYDIFARAGIAACDHEQAKSDLAEYLAAFDGDPCCPSCGACKPSFRWGLCHGEGRYACCGHPVRVYHRPALAGVEVSLQAVLPYRLEVIR